VTEADFLDVIKRGRLPMPRQIRSDSVAVIAAIADALKAGAARAPLPIAVRRAS
jgi:hypothetical protein